MSNYSEMLSPSIKLEISVCRDDETKETFEEAVVYYLHDDDSVQVGFHCIDSEYAEDNGSFNWNNRYVINYTGVGMDIFDVYNKCFVTDKTKKKEIFDGFSTFDFVPKYRIPQKSSGTQRLKIFNIAII